MIIGIVVAVVVLLGGGGAAWYFLAGPGSEREPSTPVASGPSAPAAPTASGGEPTIAPGADAGGSVSVDVEVGECVTLGGTISNATADPATCGSQESNFKVIAKTETSDGCPPDADQTFYETLYGSELGALCLDIDWVEGDCFELGGDLPQRVSCTAPPGLQTVRVRETVQGTDDIGVCDEGGLSYPDRRFVVCADQV
jgi:hypothetical protein